MSTTTARQTPLGTKLNDGFRSKIAFAADPDVSFWEKSVKPPGIDGGDKIDTTTMHNLVSRTFAPHSLHETTDITVSAAYDTRLYDNILALVNINGWISVHFPDGSVLNIVGYLKSVEFNELAEGQQPECTITICVTNELNGVETLPDWSDTGTAT